MLRFLPLSRFPIFLEYAERILLERSINNKIFYVVMHLRIHFKIPIKKFKRIPNFTHSFSCFFSLWLFKGGASTPHGPFFQLLSHHETLSWRCPKCTKDWGPNANKIQWGFVHGSFFAGEQLQYDGGVQINCNWKFKVEIKRF